MNKFKGLLLLFFLTTNFQVKADEWESPKTNFYYSENKIFMLKVVPTDIPDKYYEWRSAKQNKKMKFTERDTTIVHCYAILYKKVVKDSVIIWKRNLINKICPMNASVSNDGKYVVTFDNWSGMGYGVDVMVVYNELGDLINRYKLEDISPFPINDYLMTVTSLWWNCGNKFLDIERIEICFNVDKENKHRIFNVKEMKFEN